jgi:ribosomal subunit interface protein
MRFDIHKHDVNLTPQIEKIIARKVAKLDERLKTYHPDVARLELQLRHTDRTNSQVECALTLHAFQEELHAQKEAPELHEALDHTFDALLRELEHYRARVNKSLHPKLPKAGES